MKYINPITSEERFAVALKAVIEHEGGYSNNPDDSGGKTNFGITQKELLKVSEILKIPSDVKILTKEDAAIYYKTEWWDRYHFNAINSVPISCKIFDMTINIGPSAAFKILQKACTYLNKPLPIDGIMGTITIGIVNRLCIDGHEQEIIDALIDTQKKYYIDIIKHNPKQGIFLKGWLKRAEYKGS